MLANNIRSHGFSLQGLSLPTLMTKLIAMVASAIGIVVYFPSTSLSNTLVSNIKQITGCKSVPHLALAWLLHMWLIIQVLYVLLMSATQKDGYNNSEPRSMNPGGGRVYRLKCSADNTFESLVVFLVALAVLSSAGDELGEAENAMINKWAVLSMIARTIYPFAYVWDLDMLRSVLFEIGFFSYVAIITTAL